MLGFERGEHVGVELAGRDELRVETHLFLGDVLGQECEQLRPCGDVVGFGDAPTLFLHPLV